MNVVYDLVARIVVGFVWDVVDRGGKWARDTGEDA